MKHTPGPWRVLEISGGLYVGHQDETGATVTAHTSGASAESASSNAKLIAAAPDMLDALIDAESAMFHVLADEGFNSPDDFSAMREALAKARAVMVRAAG